ncbi:efflux RND transporter periplasmic adaptor subunit [Bacillus tianshenii]|nr:efflux RND transporter periplasmic adaptor subunit [Bacillus tianshenii]
MKKIQNRFKSSLLVMTAVVLVLAGCGAEKASTTADENVKKETPVKIAVIKKGNLQTENEIVGQAKADTQVEVYPKIAGELLSLNVAKGDWVNKGQVIGKVEGSDLQHQLKLQQVALDQARTQLETAKIAKNRAENGLENAKLSLRQAELSVNPNKEKKTKEQQQAELNSNPDAQPQEKSYTQSEIDLETLKIQWEDAKQNAERMKELYEEGAVALKEYEQAAIAEKTARLKYEQGKLGEQNSEASYNQAELGVKNAKETLSEAQVGMKQAQISVEQAQVQIAQAKDRIDDTIIRATQSGEVVQVGAKAGDTVTSQAPVVTVVSLNPIVIQATVSADQLMLFKKNQQIRIQIPSIDKDFNGKISYIASVANEAGLYEVEATVPNSGQAIKPGMVAKFIIDEVLVKDTLLVPTDAVIDNGAEQIVFTIKDGKAVAKKVEVIKTQTDWTAVRGELQPNEQIVIKGQNTLADGNLVKVIKED